MDYKKILKSRNVRLAILQFLRFVPDKQMLQLQYGIQMGKRLNLKNPHSFNEKLQWLKLNNRKDIYTTLVDKIAVKSYLAQIIAEKYLVKTLGIWESFDNVDFDMLPEQFVLKCNHDSGSVIVCKDKSSLDMEYARDLLTKRLRNNAFYYGREWPYKNIQPRIFAEEYLEDERFEVLPVYKVFCFGGEPLIIQTIQNDKRPNEEADYFDTEWKRLQLRQDFPNSVKPLDRPEQLSEMLNLAKKLSVGEPFVRIDFYIVNERIYFSEFTFFPDSGYGRFHPEAWDIILGERFILPQPNH